LVHLYAKVAHRKDPYITKTSSRNIHAKETIVTTYLHAKETLVSKGRAWNQRKVSCNQRKVLQPKEPLSGACTKR
jgi:hypothetical protein